MNAALVDKLAAALLYEGYILYPYRPSTKNQQRWTFGGIYPRTWSDAHDGSDAAMMQTECLVRGGQGAAVQVTIRFLHLIDRTIGRLPRPLAEIPAGSEPNVELVPWLEAGDKRYQPWQEATERRVELGEFNLAALLAQPLQRTFSFPHSRSVEPIRSAENSIVGLLIRRQETVLGSVELSGAVAGEDLLRVTIRISNLTPMADAENAARDEALMRSLVSTHTVLGVCGGEFISLLDPPDACRAAVADCRNIGAWPVLVGQEGEHDTMLSSPIILYDYPQLAPESPGDLFDSTEIDEILSLRILTLTDEEKRSAAGIDDRARDLVARTEKLARQQLMSLHGTLRGLRPVPREEHHV